MAIKTYNDAPYNDDFNSDSVQFTGAEGKNYLRILFKPGYSVQVRELNQMQSILQSQIDKFGQSIYKEGPILDGKGNLDNNVSYIDVLFNGSAAVIANVKLYIDQVLNINSGGIKASVLRYEALEADDTYRFFIRYDSSIQVNDLNVQEYSVDTTPSTTPNISLDNPIVDPLNTQTELVNTDTPFASVTAVGYGAVAKTDAGVYFINGQFVYNPAEELYIAKPSEEYSLNGKIAFVVTDEIVTYITDPLLLDNANGTPNDTAPGADRYKIDFKLAFLSDTNDALVTDNAGVYHIDTIQSHITLFTTDSGVVVSPARTEYTQLDRKFATRTFEESGNYCLKPFKLDLREYLNDEDGNRGRFTANDIIDLDTIEKIDLGVENPTTTVAEIYGEKHYIAGIEPSTGYVEGYRVSLKNKKDLQVEKAREIQQFNEVYTTLNLGNFVVGKIDNSDGGTDVLPDFADQTISYAIGGVTNGTCRVRSLEKISDADGGIYHLYVYDVSIGTDEYINQAASISTTSFKFIPLTGSSFELLDSNDNSLLFPLPYDTVDSVQLAYVNYKSEHTVNGTTVTISAPAGHVFYSDATSNYIGINSTGGTQYVTLNPVVVAQAGSVELTFNGDVTSVIAPIQKTTPVIGTKTRRSFTQAVTSATYATGATIDLTKFDIFDIVSVSYRTDPNDPLTTVYITDQFTLDDGQRDNYYQDGEITYIGTSSLTNRALTIVYRYFDWGTTVGDFFSANSYGADEEVDINVEYNEIPIYRSSPLADVLDFRPYKYTNNSRNALDPDTVVKLQNISIYLPRYDKIVVSTIGDFSVVKGTPAITPAIPPTPGNSMPLYELFVPAYTFDASEIDVRYIDNRRYTMRDIGAMEKRVKNLEYYTSLSMLEQEATEKKIFTNGGEERFKNGILVDSFVGHNIGNPFDSNYKCAIDPIEGVLRPSYSTNNILFGVQNGTGANENYRDQETVSFPYTEVPLITQPYASVSESVNPFDIAAWLGVLKLDPSMDEWKETRVRPDVVINSTGAADAIQFLANEADVLGTKWNEWETDWVGVDVQKESIRIGRSDKGSAATRAANLAAKKALTGSNNWRPVRGSVTTTSTTTAESRDGIRTTMNFREQEENLGERVVDISFVPFIRSRRIELHGEMFKPNTRMYVFFDGVDISAYCSKIGTASTPYDSKEASVQTHLDETADDIITARVLNGTRIELITDDAGSINAECFIPNNAAIKFKTGERTVTLTDSPKNSITEATTYSFTTYTASGLIETKQSTILSTRIAEFDQQRISEDRTKVKVNEKVKVAYYDPLAQSFVIGQIPTGTSVTKVDLFLQKKHPSIPVTMHLVTVENGTPTQNIVPFSKVVLHPTTPVTDSAGVEVLDTAENYLDNVGKRGHVAATTTGDGINGTNAQYGTTFTFDAPVYLQAGVEYAIVVMSNSPDFRLWLAETGGDDVNGLGRIDKNPYAGVSFKSQNASTWTPDQNRDFKFTMYRAKYDVNAEPLEVTFNGLGSTALPIKSISNFNVFAASISLPSTNIIWEIRFKSNDNFIPININYTEYLTGPMSITNEAGITLRARLSTTSEYISPSIDLSRISLLGISNIINNPSPKFIEDTNSPKIDNRDGDDFLYLVDSNNEDISNTADVQYITRTVVLNNPADRLSIYLLGNRPTSGSNIRVLVKLKTNDDPYDDVPWYEIKPTKNIPTHAWKYSEVEFDFNPENLNTRTAADPRFNIEFTAFAVKIVLTSTDIVNIPTVQDFRAIATFQS